MIVDYPAPERPEDYLAEEWRWVNHPDWVDLYQVSSMGRVRRTESGRPLSPSKHQKGYRVVTLSGNGHRKQFLVHRLVLFTFQGLCPENHESRHINSNPADNRKINLVWSTAWENATDKILNGTMNWGEANPMAKLTDAQVEEIISRYENGGESQRELAAAFGIRQPQVSRIITGKRRSVRG